MNNSELKKKIHRNSYVQSKKALPLIALVTVLPARDPRYCRDLTNIDADHFWGGFSLHGAENIQPDFGDYPGITIESLITLFSELKIRLHNLMVC